MTTEDTHRAAVLRRIADSNGTIAPGKGLEPNHFVPAFTIKNARLAVRLREQLENQDIASTVQVERLGTQFFVAREHLSTALRIHDEFLAQNPDIKLRRFSQDFDSVFLLSPFVLLAVYITQLSPLYPKHVWIPIVVSSVTVIVFAERINRQSRRYIGPQLGIRDLFVATAAVALNIIVWKAVL